MSKRGGRRIDALVVDDERSAREAVADLLTRAGLRVEVCSNVIRALRIIDEARVGVVVTDDRMPGPAGLALLEALVRRSPETARVLLVHGPLDAESRERARAVGATVFYRTDQLVAFRSAIVKLAHERR